MDDQQLQVWRDKLAKRLVQQWADFARKAGAPTGHDPVFQAWTMQKLAGLWLQVTILEARQMGVDLQTALEDLLTEGGRNGLG
jgi:hypothetical protein